MNTSKDKNQPNLEKKLGKQSPEKLSSSRRVLFSVFIVAIPVLFFLLAEGLLAVFNYGGNLDLFVLDSASHSTEYVLNKNFTKKYFFKKGVKTPLPITQRFSAEKDTTTYRIFCLGASTTQGFPYQPNAAFPAQMQNILSTFHPKRKIEVVNCGITAITSHSVLDMSQEIIDKYEPDLLVVYTGHNEFYGVFGQASNLAIGSSYTFIKTFLTLQKSRLFLLLRDGYISLFGEDIHDISVADNTTMMERFAGDANIALDSELFSRTESDFRDNLQAIIDEAKESNTDILICNLVSNLGDLVPFSSTAEQTDTLSLKQEAKTFIQTAEYKKAKLLLKEWLGSHPNDAAGHYFLAQSYEGLNLRDSALVHYTLARDYDTIRFRAPGSFNTIIQDLAKENDIVMVDINKAFRRGSRNGIIGEELMLEHVHPNFKGHYVMASNIARSMYDNQLLAKSWYLARDKGNEKFMAMCGLTELDHEVALYSVFRLKEHWPFPQPDQQPVYSRYGTEKTEQLAKQIIDSQQTNLLQAHLDLGEEYLSENQVGKGLAEYKAALAIKPHCDIYSRIAPIYTMRAELAFREDVDYKRAAANFRQALFYFEKGLSQCPDHFQLNFNMGLLLALREDQLQNALKHFEKALAVNPSHKKTMKMLAKIYLRENKIESAERMLKQGLQQDPEDVEFYNDLGFLYATQEEYLKAESLLNKALELEPYHSKSQKLLKEIKSKSSQKIN